MSIWQPVMLVSDHRIECKCGARAIFVILDEPERAEDLENWSYTAWCQDCWEREQEESEG